MRISDWSSDVCSSDLPADQRRLVRRPLRRHRPVGQSPAERLLRRRLLRLSGRILGKRRDARLDRRRAARSRGITAGDEEISLTPLCVGAILPSPPSIKPAFPIAARAIIYPAWKTIGSASCRERECQYG